MSVTTKHLGFLIKNRGEYTRVPETKYYKDNVVQYMNSSFICDPEDYDEQENPLAFVIAPPLDSFGNLNNGWKIFAIGSDVLAQQAIEEAKEEALRKINNAVQEYAPVEVTGNVVNAADEEDITSVNVGGTDVLKLKDKSYNSLLFSGLGKTNLRKNIQEVTVEGVTTTKNILTQAMINEANTIYKIQYDYDLNGATITVPAGCALEFDGGSISNGKLSGTLTNIIGSNYQIFNNITFAGTWNGSLNACWIGAKPKDQNFDNSTILQKWFDNYCDYFKQIVFPTNTYYFYSEVLLETDKRYLAIIGNNSTFYVNIQDNDAVFITCNKGEQFTIKDVSIWNTRTTDSFNISRTSAFYLKQTHMFSFENVSIYRFDKGYILEDVWYGGFNGRALLYENRIAIYLKGYISIECNTININNVRISGCTADAAKAIYPQGQDESEADWNLRWARCGVDVHCITNSVKYSGLVIEGTDYGIRYNYWARQGTNASDNGNVIVENCYFEGISKYYIYVGRGYIVNPNNYQYEYRNVGSKVRITSCTFHTETNFCNDIYLADCIAEIKDNNPVTLTALYLYGKNICYVDENVTIAQDSTAYIQNHATNMNIPSIDGQITYCTARQTVNNLRYNTTLRGLLPYNFESIDASIYQSNGSGIYRDIPVLSAYSDSPYVNIHTGIQPNRINMNNGSYYTSIPSGNGFVDVRCSASYNPYFYCLFSFRTDGIEITEFMRRWKAGTAYTGYVNQVFPFKVRTVPSEGKVYMENYLGTESLVGIGKKAIDDGMTFTTGQYLIFIEALCYIFYAYSTLRFMGDLVQCGRSYDEFGDSSQYGKFAFVCTESQKSNLRLRFNGIIYNKTSGKLEIYNGFEWVELTDTFKRYKYEEKGKSITERASVPDINGQSYFNIATGVTYKYGITSNNRYEGKWFGNIGNIDSLEHPNGYDATNNPISYSSELSIGEMVMYNGTILKWDGTQFVNIDGTPINQG